MKTKINLLTLFCTLCTSVIYAQAITNVKTELKTSKAGDLRLIITPNLYDMTVIKPTKKAGVYALLVCYTYNGEQKAYNVDCTYDFENDGFKELYIGSKANKSNTTIQNVSFYRRDLLEKRDYPKKTDCFK